MLRARGSVVSFDMDCKECETENWLLRCHSRSNALLQVLIFIKLHYASTLLASIIILISSLNISTASGATERRF